MLKNNLLRVLILCIVFCMPGFSEAEERISFQKFQVEVGELFTVEAYSNPSSGLTWEVYRELPEGIEFCSSEIEYSVTTRDVSGQGGTERRMYIAKAKGEYFFVLNYKQRWDESSPAYRYMAIMVEVK